MDDEVDDSENDEITRGKRLNEARLDVTYFVFCLAHLNQNA